MPGATGQQSSIFIWVAGSEGKRRGFFFFSWNWALETQGYSFSSSLMVTQNGTNNGLMNTGCSVLMIARTKTLGWLGLASLRSHDSTQLDFMLGLLHMNPMPTPFGNTQAAIPTQPTATTPVLHIKPQLLLLFLWEPTTFSLLDKNFSTWHCPHSDLGPSLEFGYHIFWNWSFLCFENVNPLSCPSWWPIFVIPLCLLNPSRHTSSPSSDHQFHLLRHPSTFIFPIDQCSRPSVCSSLKTPSLLRHLCHTLALNFSIQISLASKKNGIT